MCYVTTKVRLSVYVGANGSKRNEEVIDFVILSADTRVDGQTFRAGIRTLEIIIQYRLQKSGYRLRLPAGRTLHCGIIVNKTSTKDVLH